MVGHSCIDIFENLKSVIKKSVKIFCQLLKSCFASLHLSFDSDSSRILIKKKDSSLFTNQIATFHIRMATANFTRDAQKLINVGQLSCSSDLTAGLHSHLTLISFSF